MNKIDFKKIRTQFESSISSFDDKLVSNQNIISLIFNLDDNFDIKNILTDSISDYQPIFFSSSGFTAFSLVNEQIFPFFNKGDFKNKKDKILQSISNTFFINPIKNQKTFIFGGYSFNLDKGNSDMWRNIPIGNFTLPRYTFFDSKLIINLFLEDETDKSKIKSIIYKYINDLENILSISRESNLNSKLLNILDSTGKDIYFQKINKLIKELNINNSELIKVVISRIKKASFLNKIPLINIFKNLISKNKDNMSFLYTIKDNISIIGSTPELILSITNDKIISESVAGSNYMNNTDEFILDSKEIFEQKVVTEYIINFFNKNTSDISYNEKPFIRKTSGIEHLCTSISGVLKNNKNIFDLLQDLHPTPAIAGVPKNRAINIIEDEGENRGWYGGPIGWIDNNLNGDFFLNIRSGLGVDTNLYLFSGSGITKGSICEKEWEETEEKFNSMIDCL